MLFEGVFPSFGLGGYPIVILFLFFGKPFKGKFAQLSGRTEGQQFFFLRLIPEISDMFIITPGVKEDTPFLQIIFNGGRKIQDHFISNVLLDIIFII
jgi:hypothetical protein